MPEQRRAEQLVYYQRQPGVAQHTLCLGFGLVDPPPVDYKQGGAGDQTQ